MLLSASHVINGALSASQVFNGAALLAYCIILLLKNESSRTAVLFNGSLSARTG